MRELIPRLPIQYPTVRVFRTANTSFVEGAPLFEEERNIGMSALVTNAPSPVGIHPSSARTALSTDDDPVDAIEFQFNGT